MSTTKLAQLFTRERSCKNSVRYTPTGSIVEGNNDTPISEPKELSTVIYVPNTVLEKLGNPNRLLVQLEQSP